MILFANNKGEQNINLLVQQLDDKDYRVRDKAIKQLIAIGEPVVGRIIPLLTDASETVRRNAASILGEIKSEKAVLPLIDALNDEESWVRSEVTSALGKIKAVQAIGPLIQTLETRYYGKSRSNSPNALAAIGEPALSQLIEALNNDSENIRDGAARALGMMGSEKAIIPLYRALVNEAKGIEYTAAQALAKLGEPAIECLEKAVGRESLKIRRAVAYGLGLSKSKNAVPILKELLNAVHWGTAYAAYNSLRRIGTPAAVSAVEDLNYEYIWVDYPTVKSAVLPVNPFKEKGKSLEDDVKLMVFIDKTGEVTRAYVLEGKYRELDKAVVEAVKQWKFKPFILKDARKRTKVFLIIKFKKKVSYEFCTPVECWRCFSYKSSLRGGFIRVALPVYPDTARSRGFEDEIVVTATTDIYGRVMEIKIKKGRYKILVDSVKKAVKQWIFEPYIMSGVPRAIRFTITVHFKCR